MKNPVLRLLLAIERAALKRKTKKDVLLVVTNEIMFAYARPIYDNLARDRKIRPWLCFCSPYRFRKQNLARIRSKKRFRTILFAVARRLKWDLVLYPLHHRRFRADCKKIYVGHSMMVGKAAGGESYKYGRHTRDENNNLVYDKIFAAGAHEKEMTRRLYPEIHPTVRVVGSLLADGLLASVGEKSKILAGLGFDVNRKTIMVASTWGPHSFAQNLGAEFMEGVGCLLKTYNIIFSVHQHNFLPKCSPKINWSELARRTKLSDFHISTNNEESISLLLAADLLVTDHTSLSLYYLLLHRPIVFYENANVEYLPGTSIVELKKVAHIIRDIDNIEQDIRHAFDNCNVKEIAEAAAKVCDHQNRAWGRYKEEIYDTILLNRQSET